MPSERAFTAREKNDIFRAKRRRYEVSAGLRGGIGRDLFSRDIGEGESGIRHVAPDQQKKDILLGIVSNIITDTTGEDPEYEEIVSHTSSATQVYAPEIENYRLVIKETYLSFMEGSDMDLFRLLSRRRAAVSQIRWLLRKEPVDRVMAKYISSISPIRPGFIDDNIKLFEIPGYVEMEEKDEITIPDSESIENVEAMADEVKAYFYGHPYQFESQYLMSVVTGTEGLTDMLVKAWSILRWVDSISLKPDFGDRPMEEIRQLYDLWVLSDIVSRIGYTITELVTENRELTVGDASKVFLRELPQISFSRIIDQSRLTLKQILIERGHLDVL